MQALHDLDTHNHTATLSHLHQCTHREGRKSQSEARALFAITPAPTLFSTLRQQAGHTNALCLWLRLDFIHPILFACGHTQIHKAAGAEMLCQDGMETGHLIDAHKKWWLTFCNLCPLVLVKPTCRPCLYPQGSSPFLRDTGCWNIPRWLSRPAQSASDVNTGVINAEATTIITTQSK